MSAQGGCLLGGWSPAPLSPHLALYRVLRPHEPRLSAQGLGSGPIPQGSSKMGKQQETLQFKGLENQRAVGIFSHHGQFYTPDPTSQLSAQITGLGAREHGRGGEGGAGKAEVLEAPLATPGLKHSARSFLPDGDGASERELLAFLAQPQALPSHQQVLLEASRCVPPSTGWLPISRRTGWVRVRCLPSPQQS